MIERKDQNSTRLMRVVCAILFLLFSGLYVHYYQADILGAAQHVLSNGETHFRRDIATVLIPVALWLLQIAVLFLTGLVKRAYALTYFPSLLILLFLTSISTRIDQHFSIGVWVWVGPLLLLLWTAAVWMCRQYQAIEPETSSKGIFSRTMWINLCSMMVMFFMVGLFSCSNDVFHYRMRAEQALLDGDLTGATAVGASSSATDSSLTCLRIYALSRKGHLGDRLFRYSIVGSSRCLLPDSQTVRLVMYPEDSIYHYLGVRYKQRMTPMHYLTFSIRHGLASRPAADYLLCGYLLDRNLDAFAAEVGKYYDVHSASLPVHYKEALTLYTHLRANPRIVYRNSVMEADFQDLQKLQRQTPSGERRRNAVGSTYGNTYWFYYLYRRN